MPLQTAIRFEKMPNDQFTILEGKGELTWDCEHSEISPASGEL
jgi:hypothetical protein